MAHLHHALANLLPDGLLEHDVKSQRLLVRSILWLCWWKNWLLLDTDGAGTPLLYLFRAALIVRCLAGGLEVSLATGHGSLAVIATSVRAQLADTHHRYRRLDGAAATSGRCWEAGERSRHSC